MELIQSCKEEELKPPQFEGSWYIKGKSFSGKGPVILRFDRSREHSSATLFTPSIDPDENIRVDLRPYNPPSSSFEG